MKIVIIILVVLFLLFFVYKSIAQSQGDFTNIGINEIDGLLKTNPSLVILDVRSPKETAAGKIKKSIEINVLSADFSKKIEKLDKTKPYLVYCRSGRRSVTACNIMSKQEFANLYNLKGGYNAWVKS